MGMPLEVVGGCAEMDSRLRKDAASRKPELDKSKLRIALANSHHGSAEHVMPTAELGEKAELAVSSRSPPFRSVIVGQDFVLDTLHESGSLDRHTEIQRSPSCSSNARRIDLSSHRFSNTSVRSKLQSPGHHPIGSRVFDEPRGSARTPHQLDLEVLKHVFSEDVAQISVADDTLAAALNAEVRREGSISRNVRFNHDIEPEASAVLTGSSPASSGFLRAFSLSKHDAPKEMQSRSFRRSKSDAESKSVAPGLPRPGKRLNRKALTAKSTILRPGASQSDHGTDIISTMLTARSKSNSRDLVEERPSEASAAEDQKAPMLRGMLGARTRSRRAQPSLAQSEGSTADSKQPHHMDMSGLTGLLNARSRSKV
mmetsp:Transcript_8905/g.23357  ORF Transcript_8905/g.23357 Transcript_8905/m.23357 type:complete len:370 (+) Transcript_8905:109-1218(+)